MLKVRLMRIGAKKRPFYRVVVVDERSKRNGAYLELLGTYNPLTKPHDIKLKKDRIEYWLKMGAQKSDGLLRILGEAPKRPPRKPKKNKQVTVDSEQEKKKERPAESASQQVSESAEQQEKPAEEVVKAEEKANEESKDERPA